MALYKLPIFATVEVQYIVSSETEALLKQLELHLTLPARLLNSMTVTMLPVHEQFLDK